MTTFPDALSDNFAEGALAFQDSGFLFGDTDAIVSIGHIVRRLDFLSSLHLSLFHSESEHSEIRT